MVMVMVMMVLMRRDEKLRDDVEGTITSRHVNNLHKLAVDLDSCFDGPLYREELGLVNLNSQGGIRKGSFNLKLLVKAGIIAVGKDKLLNNLIFVLMFLDVKSLRQEQSVGDVVVSQELGQGLLAKGTEKEELELGR